MKDFNLNVRFTEHGRGFIDVFTPNFLNNDSEQCKGLSYSNENDAMREVKIYTTQLGYTFLYISHSIVFI